MPSDTTGKVSGALASFWIQRRCTDINLNRQLPVKCVKPWLHHPDGKLIQGAQAAVAWEAGKDLSIEEIEVERPKAHEVRIEIYYTGVCHTGWLRRRRRRQC